MKRSWKIKVPPEKVLELAQRFDENYARNVEMGLRLTGSSGFWHTKSKGITARFVYRGGNPRDVAGRTTMTTIITGIRPT